MIFAPKNNKIYLFNSLVDGRWGADRLTQIAPAGQILKNI